MIRASGRTNRVRNSAQRFPVVSRDSGQSVNGETNGYVRDRFTRGEKNKNAIEYTRYEVCSNENVSIFFI